jgi:hypothetical protein
MRCILKKISPIMMCGLESSKSDVADLRNGVISPVMRRLL